MLAPSEGLIGANVSVTIQDKTTQGGEATDAGSHASTIR
jgi:hypothetical protein